jgi:hypothetical protein
VPTLAQLLGGAVVIGGVMLVLSVRSAA